MIYQVPLMGHLDSIGKPIHYRPALWLGELRFGVAGYKGILRGAFCTVRLTYAGSCACPERTPVFLKEPIFIFVDARG